jgi:D-galactarolactone cycloisomerase
VRNDAEEVLAILDNAPFERRLLRRLLIQVALGIRGAPLAALRERMDQMYRERTPGIRSPACSRSRRARVSASNSTRPPGTLSADYPPQARRRYIYAPTLDCVLVRIETEDGCVGWGEAKAPVGAEATARIIQDLLAPLVIGQNPLKVRVHWERMYAAMRVRGHSTGFWLEAIAGVDIGLWDLAGRLLDQPVFVLLGGAFRDRLRVYASGLPRLYDGSDNQALERLATIARDYVGRGYTALKMALGHGIEPDVRAVEVVRQAIGPEVDLFVDAAGVYEPRQAIRLGRHLERLDVCWFEMPIPTDNLPGNIDVARTLDVPIALDALANRFQARDYVGGGGLDIIQPDVCRAGGITESLKMAEVADLYCAARAPPTPWSATCSATASRYSASALPTGTVESKMTIAISGRTARLREWRASGAETQKSSVSDAGANQTGDTQGRPSPSEVAIVMYMFASIRRRAIASVSMLTDRSLIA